MDFIGVPPEIQDLLADKFSCSQQSLIGVLCLCHNNRSLEEGI